MTFLSGGHNSLGSDVGDGHIPWCRHSVKKKSKVRERFGIAMTLEKEKHLISLFWKKNENCKNVGLFYEKNKKKTCKNVGPNNPMEPIL